MIKVGIVGGNGYTGIELFRLLHAHPEAQIIAISSRSLYGKQIDTVFPSLVGQSDLVFSTPDDPIFNQCDVIFFATPHGVAMESVAAFLDKGIKIIDLGADFRISDAKEWSKYYQIKHTQPELLKKAVYGLPEINREQIKTASLIANPGCYPTAVQLALKPLLEHNLINPDTIIADCKSGVSGAGKSNSQAMSLAETSESFKAYGVGNHRHFPEIKQQLEIIAGKAVGLTFVPHLLPMIRGIFATIYTDLLDSDTDVLEVFAQAYQNEGFINLLNAGNYPETRYVRASNFCQIAVQKIQNSHKLVILLALDNLIKGASGQAIQNMNIMFGLDENSGLEHIALLP